MNQHDYRFTIHLKVDNPVALLRRAQAQALAEGVDPAELVRYGQPIIEDCLVMLLDPGSVTGCSVYASRAEKEGT